jgi:hypothetical protein
MKLGKCLKVVQFYDSMSLQKKILKLNILLFCHESFTFCSFLVKNMIWPRNFILFVDILHRRYLRVEQTLISQGLGRENVLMLRDLKMSFGFKDIKILFSFWSHSYISIYNAYIPYIFPIYFVNIWWSFNSFSELFVNEYIGSRRKGLSLKPAQLPRQM